MAHVSIGPDAAEAATAVNERRQWDRLMAMARLGAIPGDGVNRACLTELDRQARRLLLDWAEQIGAAVSVDAAGNLWLRREGTDAGAAAVVTGSHMDSQPNGGRFDGIYGVIAGLEALTALHDARVVLPRPVEVVAWTNEEGGRFAPGCMGSMAWSGSARSRILPTWSTPTVSASPTRWRRSSTPRPMWRGARSAAGRTPMSRRISSRGRVWRRRDWISAWLPAFRAAAGSP